MVLRLAKEGRVGEFGFKSFVCARAVAAAALEIRPARRYHSNSTRRSLSDWPQGKAKRSRVCITTTTSN